MIHNSIQLKEVGLYFPHKICFQNFNARINCKERIAIIGANGSGKSSLLKMLQGIIKPSEGSIVIPNDIIFGYVPQVVEDFNDQSGASRLNSALNQALAKNPNVLLLDEPTNHLDQNNRTSLIRMLNRYNNTLVIVSHDRELLQNSVDTIWHIDNGEITIFNGHYDEHIKQVVRERLAIEKELTSLKRQQKLKHMDLMKEQERAKKSKERGKKKRMEARWPTIVADAKARQGEQTAGRNRSAISQKKTELLERLNSLHMPEEIKPRFSLKSDEIAKNAILAIEDGSVGYDDQYIVRDINFCLAGGERVAIIGDNGSGKSTIIKAILNAQSISRHGSWHVPKKEDIGYLDQHYDNLDFKKTVLDTIHNICPYWTYLEIRKHLNDFLFRKNEEVNALVETLSGGEKARLSLAQIAAKTPKLLILDEITNNLDFITYQHVIEVLKAYPGALVVISHDEEFLDSIGVERFYGIKDGKFT